MMPWVLNLLVAYGIASSRLHFRQRTVSIIRIVFRNPIENLYSSRVGVHIELQNYHVAVAGFSSAYKLKLPTVSPNAVPGACTRFLLTRIGSLLAYFDFPPPCLFQSP